jgi:Hsp70 protein/LysM domain
VENPTIGIKIADGSFFPILEEDSVKRKRLVLTTVNDNQKSVQIDLYKGNGEELLNAVYIGSLLIENILQGPKESSEIELKIGFDKDGTLNAEAGDLGSGQFESLSMSMETLGESSMYDTPEFSLDGDMDDLKIDDFDNGSQELDLDSDELSLEEDDFDLDSDELSLEEDNFDLDSDELSLEDDDFDLDSDELSLEDDDFDLDSDELSLEEEDFDFDGLDTEETLDSEDYNDDEQIDNDTEEDGEYKDEEDNYTPGILSESEVVHRNEKKKSNPFLLILLVIIALAAFAGISYFIYQSIRDEDSPILEAKANSEESVIPEESSSPEVVAVPEVQTEDAEPISVNSSEEQQADETTIVPDIKEMESAKILDTSGVWYKIRWGDTLWGISYSFYNSPKDYNTIVQENKIKNPDIIFAETEIFIPSK